MLKLALLLPATMLTLALTGCNTLGGGEDDGFVTLFDGTSTDAFRGYNKEGFPEQGWEVTDGALHVMAGGGGGDIITKEKYDSFDLRWEWKVAEGANSGVMFNVAEVDGPSYLTGPEYQILDDSRHADGRNPLTSAGSLYALIAGNDKKALKPVGEWNSSRLVIDGNHGKHYLNGELIVEYELGSDALNQLIAESKFRDWDRFAKEEAGYIAFQEHGDDVWFRNIKIRDLGGE